jgi:hypothetical protein
MSRKPSLGQTFFGGEQKRGGFGIQQLVLIAVQQEEEEVGGGLGVVRKEEHVAQTPRKMSHLRQDGVCDGKDGR